MLLAGKPGEAPALAIRLAAEKSHPDCIVKLLEVAEHIADPDKREEVLGTMALARPGNASEKKHYKITKLLNCHLMVASSSCEVDRIRHILKFYLSEDSGPRSCNSRLWSMGRSRDKYHVIKKLSRELEGKNIETQELLSELNTCLQGLSIIRGQHLYACLTKISKITKLNLNINSCGSIVGFNIQEGCASLAMPQL